MLKNLSRVHAPTPKKTKWETMLSASVWNKMGWDSKRKMKTCRDLVLPCRHHAMPVLLSFGNENSTQCYCCLICIQRVPVPNFVGETHNQLSPLPPSTHLVYFLFVAITNNANLTILFFHWSDDVEEAEKMRKKSIWRNSTGFMASRINFFLF